MTRTSRSLRLFTVAVILSLMMVPMAGARALETPAVLEAGGGWFGAALKWVEEAVGARRPNAPRPGRPGQAAPRQDAKTSMGGSCIDPQGYPKPCPR